MDPTGVVTGAGVLSSEDTIDHVEDVMANGVPHMANGMIQSSGGELHGYGRPVESDRSAHPGAGMVILPRTFRTDPRSVPGIGQGSAALVGHRVRAVCF